MALAVARASDLATLLPASFCCRAHESGPAGMHVFELPVATAPITVSQMWHPRLDADPAHRWLRRIVLSVCKPDT
jgi:DNA-binding transcriptional LysR family regulator